MAAFNTERLLVGSLFGANRAAYRLVTPNGSHGQARNGDLSPARPPLICAISPPVSPARIVTVHEYHALL